jgi:hypothetical protein
MAVCSKNINIFYGMRLVLDHEWAAKVAGNPSDLALANQNQPDICRRLRAHRFLQISREKNLGCVNH